MAIWARQHLSKIPTLPTDAELETWIDATRDCVIAHAIRRGSEPRDFAATLVWLMSDGCETLIAHIGDGCAVVQDDAQRWQAPLWPDHGEYASTTSFLIDEPSPRLRVARLNVRVRAFALFSDGIERLALDFARQEPFARFLDAMTGPLRVGAERGRARGLSKQLHCYLDSDAVNARTDDDKTLIIALRE